MNEFKEIASCRQHLDPSGRSYHPRAVEKGSMPTVREQCGFRVLQQVHAVRGFESAFHQATGLSVRLQPLPRQAGSLLLEPDDNPLCKLACSTAAGRTRCLAMQGEIRHNFENELRAQPVVCLAGLTVIAVPVRLCGEYVATLHTNHLLLHKPRPADIQRFADLVAGWGAKPDLERLREDFASLPVMGRKQVEAVVKLLGIYAEHLGDLASRRALAEKNGRPCAVAQALAYMRQHQTERLQLGMVAKHAQLSPYYFCKLFRRTMGMTFTEYLTRLRLERAKDLLMSPTMAVSDIAAAAGFGSIPHFNRAFKRYTGATPTAYRSSHSGTAQLPAPTAQ